MSPAPKVLRPASSTGISAIDELLDGGLGMMAVLKDCLELIPEHYGERVDLAQLPEDTEVYPLLDYTEQTPSPTVGDTPSPAQIA